MFDPNAAMQRNNKALKSRRIVEWVREDLPPAVKQALAVDPVHLQMNVREVQCGDPTCSPIDTVLMFVFRNGRQAMTGLPMEMAAVTQGDVKRAMAELTSELEAAHENRDFLQGRMLPEISPAGQQALNRIVASLRRELIGLEPTDVANVCNAVFDMLEQIEDEAMQPTAATMVQQGAARGMDPNAKILSASQKNDVEAIRVFVEQEGISPSYANSLGQTPLHIAAMWGNFDTVNYLLRAKANVHAVNQLSSATPLHVAASSTKDADGRTKCARLLLDHGADPCKLDADGLAPWQKVQDHGPLRDMLQQAATAQPA